MPVLTGQLAGVTVTFSRLVPPAGTELGLDDPTPARDVHRLGVIEKSSIPSPSSAFVASKSVQRIKNVEPLGMFKLEMVALTVVRLTARFPSKAPIVPVVMELEKSRLSTST